MQVSRLSRCLLLGVCGLLEAYVDKPGLDQIATLPEAPRWAGATGVEPTRVPPDRWRGQDL